MIQEEAVPILLEKLYCEWKKADEEGQNRENELTKTKAQVVYLGGVNKRLLEQVEIYKRRVEMLEKIIIDNKDRITIDEQSSSVDIGKLLKEYRMRKKSRLIQQDNLKTRREKSIAKAKDGGEEASIINAGGGEKKNDSRDTGMLLLGANTTQEKSFTTRESGPSGVSTVTKEAKKEIKTINKVIEFSRVEKSKSGMQQEAQKFGMPLAGVNRGNFLENKAASDDTEHIKQPGGTANGPGIRHRTQSTEIVSERGAGKITSKGGNEEAVRRFRGRVKAHLDAVNSLDVKVTNDMHKKIKAQTQKKPQASIQILSGSEDRLVKLWDFPTDGQQMVEKHTMPTSVYRGHVAGVTRAMFDESGGFGYSAGMDSMIYKHKLTNKSHRVNIFGYAEFLDHSDVVWDLALIPKESGNGSVEPLALDDTESGLHESKHDDEHEYILVSGSADGTCKLWDINSSTGSGEAYAKLLNPKDRGAVSSLCRQSFTRNSVIVAYTSGDIVSFDCDYGKATNFIPGKDSRILRIVSSPLPPSGNPKSSTDFSGLTFALSENNQILYMDFRHSNKILGTFQIQTAQKHFRTSAIDFSGNLLVTGNSAGYVMCWDPRAMRCVTEFPLVDSYSSSRKVTNDTITALKLFNTDGNSMHLAVGEREGYLSVYSV